MLGVAAVIDAETTMPGMRPPVMLWFLARVQKWMLVVAVCALPLLLTVWARSDAGGHWGMLCGVALWMTLIVVVDERLRQQIPPRHSERLRAGAVLFALLQAVIGFAFGEVSLYLLFMLYVPAVKVSAMLRFIPLQVSEFEATLALTLLCGGQAAVCAYGLGWLTERWTPLTRMVRRW